MHDHADPHATSRRPAPGWRQAGLPWLATVVLSLAAALLLTACGGDGELPASTGQDAAAAKAVLVTVQPEPAGIDCAAGGSRIQAGVDTDGDGSLGAAEVTSTQYVCNGSTGASGATGSTGTSTLTLVTDAGAHCATGGKAISVGSDADADGVLEAG